MKTATRIAASVTVLALGFSTFVMSSPTVRAEESTKTQPAASTPAPSKPVGIERIKSILGNNRLGLAETKGDTKTSAAKPAQGKSLEALLKEAEIDYTVDKDGGYKVMMSDGENTCLLYVDEVADKEDQNFRYMRTVSIVVQVPEGFKHPAAMLKKIAELNDTMILGRLGVSTETGNVYYRSTMWLRTADADQVAIELSLPLYLIPGYRKDLKPFVKEE